MVLFLPNLYIHEEMVTAYKDYCFASSLPFRHFAFRTYILKAYFAVVSINSLFQVMQVGWLA